MRRTAIDRETPRRMLGLLGAMVVLAGAATGAGAAPGASAAPAAAPRVEVEAEQIDLGKVARGDTVEARFRLRNAGARELRILDVKPG